MTTSIQIKDNATPALRRITAALRAPGLRTAIGREGRDLIRAHLFSLDSKRHRAHVKLHFYGAAARATNFRTVSDGAIVSINHVGIAQRFFGGTIRPRNSKYLTIPARPEAEGKRARKFDDLFFGKKKGSNAAFLAKKKQKPLSIFYILVKSVTQRPDPSVLPTQQKLERAVETTANNYINRILERTK